MSAAVISSQAQEFVKYKHGQQQFFHRFIKEKKNNTTSDDVHNYVTKLNKQLSNLEGYDFIDANHDLLSQEYQQLAGLLDEQASHLSLLSTKHEALNKKLERYKKTKKYAKKEAELTKRLSLLSEQLERSHATFEKERFLAIHYAVLLSTHASYYHGPSSDQVKAYQAKINQWVKASPASKASWSAKVLSDLEQLAATPLHTSKLRSWIGFINIYRIHIVMDRLTWKQVWRFGQELHWLDQFGNFLGMPINVAILDMPAGVSNALSVGLFASRFMINAGMILKHTLFSETAQKGHLAQIFWTELKKRHWVMVNDLVWGTVNALTNYNAYFHIADATAGWVLAGFLLFDALWLGWKLYLDHENYKLKKAQYDYELSKATTDEEKHILKEQLRLLSNQYQAGHASVMFSMAAAYLLVIGFSTTMIFASPALISVVCFFVCTTAVAMYLSADKFGAWTKSSLVLEQDKAKKAGSLVIGASTKAVQQARQDFFVSMAKSTFMPLLIVGAYTFSWPAALMLTALYIGYECSLNYRKQASQAQLVPLSLVEKKQGTDNDLDENIETTKRLAGFRKSL